MDNNFFATEKISRILLKMAPPVMLAQLIQALYNIVDSLFVGKYSASGLTALSIIYPIQLLMIALAVGTGVGINTSAAYYFGLKKNRKADEISGLAAPLAFVMWIFFAVVCYFIMPYYARMSTDSLEVIEDVVSYGRIVCVFSFGLMFESVWTKVLQARGDMKTPMAAQIVGAIVNIILDPLLIFGLFKFPEMGISGAAVATVAGQIAAAIIVMLRGFKKSPELKKYPKYILHIYKMGLPNIIMQSAYTFYIFGLNMILTSFCDEAVTALGLYYKWQTFFFIPLGALQICVVPIISFNYASRNIERCRKTFSTSLLYGAVLMFAGTLCFEILPTQMLLTFSQDAEVLKIGVTGFRIIGLSFVPQAASLMFPVIFLAVGHALKSSLLTFLRTLVFFVPLGYLFSLIGLDFFWLTFPLTEILTALIGVFFYWDFLKKEGAVEPKRVKRIR